MKERKKLKEFLYMEWLRMEKVVWNTRASLLIGEALMLGNRICEVGIGNGYFTFMTLGGEFKPEYDWYYNVNTKGFWEGKDIYVKDKKHSISQVVSETILNLRRHLVTLKINELAEMIKEIEDEELKKNTLIETVDYSTLKKILSDKLNRVL